MPYLANKQHLARRTFLRAGGAALALPWLDAMLPAFASKAQAAAATAPPKRLIAMNFGLGIHVPFLVPKETGLDYKATPYLAQMEEHRGRFTVLSGLSHPEQNGGNGHTSEMTIFTSATHPGLPGFRNSVSFDQYILEKLLPDTRFPCLTLNVGGGDSMSWASSGVNLPGDNSPAKLFQRLFVAGTPGEIYNQMRDLKRGKSILDAVNGRAKELHGKLGGRDREKVDQYLTSVRELEGRLQASEAWVQRPKPKVDVKPPVDVADRNDVIARSKLMHDLVALALQTDSTRFVTIKAGAGGDVPKIEGVDTGWHDLSHHGQDEGKINELKLIEEAEFREIGRLLSVLHDVKEAQGSLLDHTTVFATSNLGSASSHSWRDLPVLVAGGGFKHTGHVVAGGAGLENARLSNLFVQIGRKMGADMDRFGSSDGTAVRGFDV